ncbi:O-methyltransferase [Streptomyces sp. NPDC000941]
MSLREDDVLRELRERTDELPMRRAMQVMAEEGQLLGLLGRDHRGREVLEIRTFTGYSTLCMARALPSGGRLVTCDTSAKWPDSGVEYWKRAGVADRIEVRICDATETLTTLLDEDGAGAFDLAFIDADKANYRAYFEKCFELLRPGGLIVVDNTLFSGRVVDAAAQDPDTVAVRELNSALRDDGRADISLLPMADGITLVRKRP